jgi:hypothetical protein
MSGSELRNLIPMILFWGVLPLWLVAGFADWLLHRRTSIEHTSGFRESTLHALQAVQIGIPLVAGLFFEINSLVLAVMILAVIVHMLTALWDTLYTNPRRYISPLEQHIHSHLEYLPVVAVLLVVLLHWDAFLGLFGTGETPASFVLRLKAEAVPLPYTLGVLIPVVVVQGGLLIEEMWRTASSRSPSNPG